MGRNRLTVTGLAAGLAVLGLDQATKYWVLEILRLPELRAIKVLPVLNLTWVENRGVTFGLLDSPGGWSPFVLAGVALMVVVALVVWLRRAEGPLMAVALGAVAGGAIGNVIDRLRFGYVVDFLHFHVGAWSWYVFNVADSAIVCGVVALVIDGLWPRRSDGK